MPTGRVFQCGSHIADTSSQRREELERRVAEVSARLLRHGVTSLQDAGEANGASELRLLADLVERRIVRQRLWTMVSGEQLAAGKVCAADLSARTRHAKLAAVEARLDPDALVTAALAARAAGLGVAIHAASEAELAAAVYAIATARAADAAVAGSDVYRIEHACVSTDAAVDAVADLDAAVVANPLLVREASDGYLAADPPYDPRQLHRLGSWRRRGVALALASDAPVTESRPLALMQAALDRRTRAGVSLGAAEALDEKSALAAVTAAPGALVGMRGRIGVIAPGACADLVMLRGWEPGRPGDAEVALTVVDGVVSWAADDVAEARDSE